MKLLSLCAFTLVFCELSSLPQEVISSKGGYQLNGSLNSMEITAENNTKLEWRSFSIGADECVKFILPSKDSAIVNKVVGGDPSEIFGSLFSNGKVFLINPGGIWIGKDARIDTMGFIASTLDEAVIQTDKNQRFHFSGEGSGPLSLEGQVLARDGDVVLVANHLKIDGKIDCLNGNAFILGSKDVYIADESFDQLFVDDRDINSAVVQLNGSISSQVGERGGSIQIAGAVVDIGSEALLDVSGDLGGGEIWIGKAPEVIAQEKSEIIIFPEGANARANALKNGDGGIISLVSEGVTVSKGLLQTKGGPEGGDGGFIEISGHKLDCNGSVDATAPLGKSGVVVFDPLNIQIIPGAVDTNVVLTILPGPIYQYDPTLSPATISFGTINTALGMADVVVRSTGGAGAELGDLLLVDDYIIASAAPNTLTLEGYRQVEISASLIYPTPGSIVLRSLTGGVGVGGHPLQTTNAIVSVSNGNLTVDGSLTVEGNAAGPFYAYVEAPQGDIIVNSPGNGLRVAAGAANGAFAQIGSPVATGGSVNSNITISTDLDFRILASSGMNAYAKIGHGGTVLPLVAGTLQGDITLTTHDDLFLRGGSGQGAFAAIGHQGGDGVTAINVSGDIEFTIDDNVFILGGNSPGGAFARVGHGGDAITAETYSGSIDMVAGGQYFLLGGNTNSPAVIGYTVNSSTGAAIFNAPLVHVESTSSLPFLMQAGTGLNSDAFVGGFISMGGAGSSVNVNVEVITAGDLNLNPTTGLSSSQIGLGSGAISLVGNVDVNVGGNININMVGSGGVGGINIDVTTPGFSNVVTVTAQNIFCAADGTTAGFSSNGSINITTIQDCSLDAQGPAGSTRIVGLNGVHVFAGGNFTLNSATTLPASSSVQAYNGSLVVEVGNDVFLLDATGVSAPPFSSNIFNFGTGTVDVIAGRDMVLENGTGIGAISGIVNLVVDNLFPSPPLIGPGELRLLAGSFVIANAGQNIRLFTALQNLNLIQGTLQSGLNSVTGFTGGPLYANNAPEKWGVYYFNSFYYSGQIFTIFYKDFLEQITSVANTVLDEMLFNFNPQDEYTEWPDEFVDLWRFEIGYDASQAGRKRIESSRLYLGTEYYWIARRKFHFIKNPFVNRSFLLPATPSQSEKQELPPSEASSKRSLHFGRPL